MIMIRNRKRIKQSFQCRTPFPNATVVINADATSFVPTKQILLRHTKEFSACRTMTRYAATKVSFTRWQAQTLADDNH